MGEYDETSYLSLSAASHILGVHATTLRRWADAGAIPVYTTPGGHRRFARRDLEALAARRTLPTRAMSSSSWAVRALAQARSDMSASQPPQRWLAHIDEADRATWRRIGQQLMGVVLHYLHSPSEEVLNEARRIGTAYAEEARRVAMPLTAALEAALFFRDSLVDSAMQLSGEVHPHPDEHARLLRRISRIANEVQLAVAASYEAPPANRRLPPAEG